MAAVATPTALVLCGGLGTRLRPALADRPKALAPVAGRPFLAWLLDQLAADGIERTVLCTGHLSEAIEESFAGEHLGMEVVVSREPRPLDTAGAIRRTLSHVAGSELLVLNGDSYCDVAPSRLCERLLELRAGEDGAQGVLALVEVPDTSRYGRVDLAADGAVMRFVEKEHVAEDGGDGPTGWVNAGLYCLRREVIEALPSDRALSLERQVFPDLVGRGLYGLPLETDFVDIGTPEALESAQEFFERRAPGVSP